MDWQKVIQNANAIVGLLEKAWEYIKPAWKKLSAIGGVVLTWVADWPVWTKAIATGVVVYLALSVIEHIWNKRYVSRKKYSTKEKELSDYRKVRDELQQLVDDKERKLSDFRNECRKKNERLQRQVEGKERHLSDLKQKFGKWRIKRHGLFPSKSRGLSVGVYFIAVEDADLAEKIRDFFWQGEVPLQGFPWINTFPVAQAKWFKNRISPDRIAIFSDHKATSEGLADTFNECSLLAEPMSRVEMNFASEEVSGTDIAIVVFPKETP